ncbi:hypothetical protein [Streptomyces sp. SID14515]|uniref:hypothetical protein n=1 Tax=Streptomyces sp. SID14515 TaxID=2706074 RepID=UPI0031BA06D9
MITARFERSPTDVVTCEACWNAPVQCARIGRKPPTRDLLCILCAEGVVPVRVDLFPPFGMYGVTGHTVLEPAAPTE